MWLEMDKEGAVIGIHSVKGSSANVWEYTEQHVMPGDVWQNQMRTYINPHFLGDSDVEMNTPTDTDNAQKNTQQKIEKVEQKNQKKQKKQKIQEIKNTQNQQKKSPENTALSEQEQLAYRRAKASVLIPQYYPIWHQLNILRLNHLSEKIKMTQFIDAVREWSNDLTQTEAVLSACLEKYSPKKNN